MNKMYRMACFGDVPGFTAALGSEPCAQASHDLKGAKSLRLCSRVALLAVLGGGWIPEVRAALFIGEADPCTGKGSAGIFRGRGSATEAKNPVARWESIAIGSGSTAGATPCAAPAAGIYSGYSAIALGTGAYVQSGGLGIGYGAQSTGMDSVVLGPAGQAKGSSSVALGAGASDNGRNDVVSIGLGGDKYTKLSAQGGSAPNMSLAPRSRQLINLSAGTQDTDAVNVSQLKGVIGGLGGGSKLNADGTVTGPNYVVDGKPANNVGDALTNIDGRTTRNTTAITNLGDQLTNGTIGLVQQDATTKNITVAKAKDGKQVLFAGTEGDRVLTGVAKGTVSATSVEAINGSQLYSTSKSVANHLGGGSTVNPDGTVSAPNYTVGGKTSNNVGDALTNVDGRVTQVGQRVTNLGDQINNGTVGLVQQDATSKNITVAKDKDGKQVSFAGTAGDRVLTGVAKGTVSATSVEAINGSQLYSTSQSVANHLGGGSAVNPDGTVSAPNYTVGGKTSNNVGDALTNVDGRVTQVDQRVSNLGDQLNNGTVGLVQQDATTKNITVAKAKDGKQVLFAGTEGDRVLTGVAKGAVSPASVEAINGSQLYSTSKSVANHLGGGSTVNPDGAVSAPTYTVNGTPVNNVGDALTNIDGRTSGNTTAITNLGDQINNGRVGLVQQDATSKNITVAKDKDGKQVSFAGTEGDRVLTGVAKGAVSATSVEAINGSQLYSTSKSVANHLGGGSTVNPDGTVSAPTYTVNGKPVNNVGDALTNIDGRVTNNSTAITDLGDQLNSGSIGLVRQDATSRDILVANDKDGKSVSFAGLQGNRVLLGVAPGAVNEMSVEAINGSQLYATNKALVDSLGGGAKVNPNGTIGAPTYTVNGKPVNNVGDAITNIDGRVTNNSSAITQLGDQINNGSVGLVKQDATSREITVAKDKDGKQVSFGGTEGERVLTGVDKGAVDATSTQAVNGSQLHATSKSVADSLGGGAKVNPDGTIKAPTYTVNGKPVSSVGEAISNVDGRVTNNTQAIQNIVGSGGVKYFRANSTAGAAQASGTDAVAAGPETVASGASAVAIGKGARATADNSVALGAGSVANRANTVSVGRAGNERTISHVAPGRADTDAVNVSQLNSGMEQAVSRSRSYTDAQVQALGNDMWQLQRESRAGTASAMAMAGLVQAYEAGDSLMSMGVGGFQGEYSMAVGLSGVTDDGKYLYKAQASRNTRKDVGFSVAAGWRW